MITETDNELPSLGRLTRRVLATGLGALQNRGELFLVELQEEKGRLLKLILVGVGALFLAMMTALLITGTVIFLLPEDVRIWGVIGFTVLYLGATIWAILTLKGALKNIPFAESLHQIKKDSELLDAIK